MFKPIFLFELKYRLKRPATWAYFGILFVFGLFTAIYGNTPASEKTLANSPIAISTMLIVISIFVALIASAVMGVPVYRDIEHNVKSYYFSYPITEKGYLLGRYFGSLLFLFLISLGMPLGMILGFALGPIAGLEEAERFGPLQIWHYIQPTLNYYWPNLILTGTVFFALVAFTRKVFVTYVGSILFFIGYLLANALVQDLEMRNIVDILDPFALNTFENATKYMTPVEQNTQLVGLSGNLLWNRLLWGGISLLIFLITLFRFNFQRFLKVSSGKKEKTEKGAVKGAKKPSEILIPQVSKVFSNGIYWRQLFRLAQLEFRNIIRDVYFIAMLIGGVIFLFLDGWFGNSTFSTPALPTTYYMLEVKNSTYIIFVFIILIFYTGEVVHRDKSLHYSGISDALPIPNWTVYGSKFLSLLMVSFLLINLVLVCGLLNQVLRGYFKFDWGQYFTDLYLFEFPLYIQLTMLAFFVHILINKKFLGHVVAIGVWIILFGIRVIGEYDYNLFFYSYRPSYLISDMNRFGHFFAPTNWFNFYWLALGTGLLILGNLMWNRGSESSFKARWKLVSQRLNAFSGSGLLFSFGAWLAAGAFIYYNVSVLNPYFTNKQQEKRQVEYEKEFSKYRNVIQPKITDVKVNSEIYPEKRSTVTKGIFEIVNKSNQNIDSLHFCLSSPIYHTEMTRFTIEDQEPEQLFYDEDHRYWIYKIPGGMKPNDTMQMVMVMEAGYKGFTNSGYNREIIDNGTFFNLSIFPGFGYDSSREIFSDQDRKKYDLPEKDYTLPEQDDDHGLSNLLFNDDADYVTFEAILGTSLDQIAIAPGYLQKEWEKDGRKYFQYKMDGEMDYFFNISSARYAVHKDTWDNPDGSKGNIEIFYHPTHDINLDRFVNGVRHSMEYYNENFSPYQYRQMRILEFPRYAGFAQSFPNTVPYSESFGWVGDFSDPNDTDYAYYVTAHEVAHQWWGHQITPSATRGSNQISESMAEYSALMVLKGEYGEEVMQRFLRYSLDSYLSGRANESKFEKTLLDNDVQAYVWYRKGSLILYALQDYVTEDSLNIAFNTFLKDAAFRQQAPFATSNEWYTYIQAATPDSLEYFIDDSFKNIVLYENKTKKATSKKLGEEEYEITLELESKKIYYDGLGATLKEGTDRNLIEIGVFAADGKNDKGMKKKTPLYLEKHWLEPGLQTLTIKVKGEPEKAGIDPYTKLIDRVPEDNLMAIE